MGLYFGVGLAKSGGSTPSPNDSLHFKLSGIDQILAIVLEESFFTWRRRQWVVLSFKLCLCHLFMPIDVVGFPSKIIHLLWMEDLPQTQAYGISEQEFVALGNFVARVPYDSTPLFERNVGHNNL